MPRGAVGRASWCSAREDRTLKRSGPEGIVQDVLLPTARFGIGIVDEGVRVTALNGRFGELLGVPVDAIRMACLDDVAPTVGDRWRDLARRARTASGLDRQRLVLAARIGRVPLDVMGWPANGSRGPSLATLVIEEGLVRASTTVPVAAERARVARELHDGLAQELWLAKLAAARLDADPSLGAGARQACRDLLRSLDGALTEVRTAIVAMGTVVGPNASIAELIAGQVDEFADRFGIDTDCVIQATLEVPPRISVELVRIVQEALNNVRKHAEADHVRVAIEARGSSLVVSIRDDGVGFDPAIPSHGYGFASMRERAHAVGAQLTIVAVPGRGTTVRIRLPMALAIPR